MADQERRSKQDAAEPDEWVRLPNVADEADVAPHGIRFGQPEPAQSEADPEAKDESKDAEPKRDEVFKGV